MSESEEEGSRIGWHRARLGDVVENINDFYGHNSRQAVRYVAGEHIDEGDLRVRRNGLTSDDLVPPTFNRLFKAGDVLFHSRNIKKLAQPDFDGLTGEKLFVLRTKDERHLAQAFLPFLLQSEHFASYVQERWAGSTNKFLNKTPLMAYEFALPPIEQQGRIVKRMRAVDALFESLKVVHLSQQRLVGAALAEMTKDAECLETTLEKLAELVTDGDHNPPKRQVAGVPHLVVANISDDGRYSFDGCTFISLTDFERVKKRYTPKEGDLLITCVGSIGRVAIVDKRTEFSADRSLAVVRPSADVLLPEYAYYILRSPQVQSQFSRMSIGTAQAHLYLKELRGIKVNVPATAVQKAHLEVLREIDHAALEVAQRLVRLASFRRNALVSMEGIHVH